MAPATDTSESEETPAIRWRQVFQIYTTPTALFERVEDTPAYAIPLVALLVAVTLCGYVQVQTGLIDRDMDRLTEDRIAKIEKNQANLVDRIKLKESMEDASKQGEFDKTMGRLGAVVFAPAAVLIGLLAIAAMLYAVVALQGRKPEYHTLMSICVYSAFIELVATVLRTAMMLAYGTSEVSSTLGMLIPSGEPQVFSNILSGIDPFRLWFWVLVICGLITTRQLSRRLAICSGGVLGVLSTAGHIALAFAPQAS